MNLKDGEGSAHRIIEAHLENMPEGPGRNRGKLKMVSSRLKFEPGASPV
jgi:hypothetical protein